MAAYKKKQLLMDVLIVTGLATIVVMLIWRPWHHQNITAAVRRQASFTIFYPNHQQAKLRPGPATYDTVNHAISFTVIEDGKKVVVSEQNTPDTFSQNGVYDLKLNQAHEYDSFSTTAGEVALTKPTELNGQTLAWVNSRGTLTLARAFQNLSENDWKVLFNSMESQ